MNKVVTMNIPEIMLLILKVVNGSDLKSERTEVYHWYGETPRVK
jgi:hypothetical protein